ncbi:MAG: hypothetical protein QXU47_09295 [Candidatus Bathyarchaeia archaeon]
MNPKLKKRLVDSIDYLRKMDFFKDYSNLTSEEILEKIFRGELNYSYWYDEWEEKHPPPGGASKYITNHGILLRQSLDEYEDHWMRHSDAEIDYSIIPYDMKRTVIEEPETMPDDEMGKAILSRLARISRGIFQPENIESKWATHHRKWLVQEVSFDFKGERHTIQIVIRYDWIEDMGLEELNKILEDTGYQYYQIDDEYIKVVMLTKEEAEKLKKERGWKFEYLH